MEQIGAFEAKTHLASLLDRVERGEELMITRRGRPVAKLVPVVVAEPPTGPELVARMRRATAGIRLDGLDWRTLRDEGRP